jgi:hypothetical protein
MADEPDSFSWQPTEPRRRVPTAVWLGVVFGFAAVGAALGYLQPFDKAVSAIERNGVPKATIKGPAIERTLAAEQSPRTASEAAASPPKVVLLNPGTIPDEQHPAEVEERGKTSQRGEAERADLSPRAEGPALKPGPPVSTKPRDRKVLVIVRRVVAPHDKRVLRGRIVDGRLVLDGRDTRGITIR